MNQTNPKSDITQIWEFVEEFYPKYYSSDEIALADDLQKIVDGEVDETDVTSAATILEKQLKTDGIDPQTEYDRVHREIYEAAIENFLKSER